MALSFAQPQVKRPGPVGAPPCRSLQPLRPGQPAARVGPATGSGRRPCVASTLCWLTGMENTSFPKPQKESTLRMLSFCGSGSYLSFHDCAAWSFPSGQASSRYGLPVFSSSASPCRSLQPLRPGQPAARVGPATGSGRRPCVASTLCWLTGMENTSFPKPQKESTLRVLSFCGSGSYLSFHAVASTVFSAYKGLTSVFGMGTGGSP